jgi:CRP-like cAMP-binding protein
MSKSELLNNKLLSALPGRELDLLFSKASVTAFDSGTVLCEADSEVHKVYFPLNGMMSLDVIVKPGKAIETAIVGREGVFGAMAGLGIYISQVRAVVQIPLRAVSISAGGWRKLVSGSPRFGELAVRYNEVLLTQARTSAACNALHQIEARLCRKLLQTSDHAPSGEIKFTQSDLSRMLGVRRTSITDAAAKMQEAGIIAYSRGHIAIIDRVRLKQASCECYERLRQRTPT